MEVLLEKHNFPLSLEDQATIGYIYKVFVDYGPGLEFSLGGTATAPDTPNYADLMVATDGKGRQRSFLASEQNFAFVQAMHRYNLIVPLVGDFAGTKALLAVGRYLKEHDATVSAFYTSVSIAQDLAALLFECRGTPTGCVEHVHSIRQWFGIHAGQARREPLRLGSLFDGGHDQGVSGWADPLLL
jgi:hypothetical protein